METENFEVLNIKCGGCVEAIRNGLLALPGIDEVHVDQPTGRVAASGTGLSRQQISGALAELGYPERS